MDEWMNNEGWEMWTYSVMGSRLCWLASVFKCTKYSIYSFNDLSNESNFQYCLHLFQFILGDPGRERGASGKPPLSPRPLPLPRRFPLAQASRLPYDLPLALTCSLLCSVFALSPGTQPILPEQPRRACHNPPSPPGAFPAESAPVPRDDKPHGFCGHQRSAVRRGNIPWGAAFGEPQCMYGFCRHCGHITHDYHWPLRPFCAATCQPVVDVNTPELRRTFVTARLVQLA